MTTLGSGIRSRFSCISGGIYYYRSWIRDESSFITHRVVGSKLYSSNLKGSRLGSGSVRFLESSSTSSESVESSLSGVVSVEFLESSSTGSGT